MTSTELVTTSRQDDWKYAQALATARDQLPRKFQDQPGNILVAMEYARSLNLPLMVGITGVQVIDGVPSVNAQTMQALVRRAGHQMRVAGDNRQATCEIVRRDDPEYTYSVVYTLEDAQQAGLLQIQPDGRVRSRTAKGNATPWEAHTRAMLRARAISECCRMACADVLAGVAYTPEELGAVVDAEPWPETATLRRPTVAEDDPPTAPARRPTERATAYLEPDPEASTEASGMATEPSTYADPAVRAAVASEARSSPLARARQTVAAERDAVERRTQAEANTDAERERWETDMGAAEMAGDLAAIAQLGKDAYANGWSEMGARARGIWARVQARTDAPGQ